MAKSPWFTEDEMIRLVEVVLKLQEEYKQGKRKALPTTPDIHRTFNERNSRRVSRSTLEKKLAKLRDEGKLPKPEATMPTEARSKPLNSIDKLLDEPWTLGSLASHDLPTDAISDVVEAWKLCLAIGTPLSIRTARWIGWLRSTIPGVKESGLDRQGQLEALNAWAHFYALRERATEALGIDNDTRDLDAGLVSMGAWEWYTALSVGALSSSFDRWEENRRISDMEVALERDTGHYSHLLGGWPHEAVEQELGGLEGWVRAKHPIAGTASWRLEMIYPSQEESRVYAYWLRYLSNGPRWEELPFDRRRQIAVRLREEVQAVEAATQQYRDLAAEGKIWNLGETEKAWGDFVKVYPSPGHSIGPDPGPLPPVPLPPQPYRQPRPPFFAWKPKDLLKEVGYEE